MPKSIVSGIIGTNANKSALRAQSAAATQATDVQERMYNQSRADLEPFRKAGVNSNNTLSYLLDLNASPNEGGAGDNYDNVDKSIGGYGSLSKKFALSDFTADPGQQFVLDQGYKGMDRKASSTGNIFSGKALKEAINYGQNTGNQFFGDSRNRYIQDQDSLYNKLSGVTNTGIGATNTGVTNNTNNASELGNIYGQLGNAKASSRLRQSDIYNDALYGPEKRLSSFTKAFTL